jgi:hypothetical protein
MTRNLARPVKRVIQETYWTNYLKKF